ncbi:MAG: phosphoribosyltransferase [Defluviitaleaceae bacterium]|nr:phosphoribosyltransferase [Defluviitaleaceae bacterium]
MNENESGFMWGNFPLGYGHTSIAYLKNCFGYEDARNGNILAAQYVVRRCVKPKRLAKFRKRFAGAFVVPVISGKNALPTALANETGLKLWDKVYRIDTVKRKQLPAIKRLQHKPVFRGAVKRGAKYVIVDDVITQGGTVVALRNYILSNGGKVVAVMALAYSIGSYHIAPTREKYVRLFLKFGSSIFWMQDVGLISSFEEMTNSQARYLLMFSSTRRIHKKLAEMAIVE